MKPTFKTFATLLILGFVLTATTATAEVKTKEYNQTWAAANVHTLEIANKFGRIKVNDNGGGEITIDVTITVEARDEKRADDLLSKINIVFRKSGGVVKATTYIENNFKSQRKFSIDYVVNVPADKNLKISNKYGNTIVNQLTGTGAFNIQYGNLTANELMGDETRLALAYGNASIGSAGNAVVEVKYSPVSFGQVNDLKLTSKYSDISVEGAKSVQIDSKYDKLSFEEVEAIVADTKYSHLRIEKLIKNLKIEAGYGSVKVDEVAAGFDAISITNSYGQISLGLGSAEYMVDANCQYCGISYPEAEFSGNKMKENNTKTIVGKIGSGSGGKVVIRSRYGDIRLRD